VKHPEGTLTSEQLHALLANPRILARRLADITKMGFIADFLLQGRFDAAGGGIFYETGEDPFTGDQPESVAPNAEYPKTVLFEGETVAAATKKWGIESDFTDEKVSRQGINYVNRGLARLGNSVIKRVDGIAMAVIMAKIASTYTSPATWTTAGKMVTAVTSIRTQRANLGTGLDLNTVVLTPTQYALVIGMLIDDKALPREAGNPVVNGLLPVDALGLTWATSPHYTGAAPLLVDREQLGGMADEKLDAPDYVRSGESNIEIRTERTSTDARTVRARRVTVPVVTDVQAGVQLLGTGL
jgi:hypothetical protein